MVEPDLPDCSKCPAEGFCTLANQDYRMDYCVFNKCISGKESYDVVIAGHPKNVTQCCPECGGNVQRSSMYSYKCIACDKVSLLKNLLDIHEVLKEYVCPGCGGIIERVDIVKKKPFRCEDCKFFWPMNKLRKKE